MNKNLVFVYGTLKLHGSNNYILRNSSLVAPALTLDANFDMWGKNRGFPYVLTGGKSHVKGEVWHVDSDETWRYLDGLEGVPTHFDRIFIEARLYNGHHDNDVVSTFMYVAGTSTAKVIRSRGHSPDTPSDDNILEWNRGN